MLHVQRASITGGKVVATSAAPTKSAAYPVLEEHLEEARLRNQTLEKHLEELRDSNRKLQKELTELRRMLGQQQEEAARREAEYREETARLRSENQREREATNGLLMQLINGSNVGFSQPQVSPMSVVPPQQQQPTDEFKHFIEAVTHVISCFLRDGS
uniref:Uncharacterized protein n=1 Tax=Anopheles culicifacies TaxID=139723 RepID=A0A182MMW4_9DIPT